MLASDPFPKSVIGYPKLARKIDIQPELAIFRRFGALNALNLLYFQAELTDLEEKLTRQQVEDDQDRKGTKAMYAKTWYRLQESEENGDTEQLDLVLRMRELLKKYNKALIQQRRIHSFHKHATWDLHYMQNYLQTDAMGPLALTGDDAGAWGSVEHRKSHQPDLVALCPRTEMDPFSKWAADSTILNLFKCGCARLIKPSRIHGVVGYEDSTIYRITYWITSVLASLLPIASIAVLYCVHSMPMRLVVIAVFNMLVTLCLVGFTNARRAEVFAVTAAFAAVQVVFVATDKTSH
ncbi:hypothetical protein HBH56_051130 [Parastagonospora nodorum]|uniref:DUF6594 domain-containing protein n=1 Tax=Phaeosphaeria nodorum (strain SN15 / ATCC MYA-4574 / FGSC 10173) TaxID=321614 RepID=A0A7U2FB68_PHANO|nr:hypothetical protein HBH56_051130 [Parastagonospora nodorum]QRD02085.1 hypothetical protein JI435_050530 [Parastagonospora nodorum SN15]KAH3935949.1 hypothetical protein HBH54_036920 [Parastagonospora nodorum]KAH4140162.1 hypothetical protein HBH45_086130 [Parastagonospora nodorum]KAH4152957.1 hypothetical protein HBH44_156310 [Parastagonospora nodorum]